MVPVAGELPSYRVPSARRDLVAGVTVAALAIPAGMAYAELARLSPVNGLYALLLSAVAYLLLGSSRQLIAGPEGSIAAVTTGCVIAFGVLQALIVAVGLSLIDTVRRSASPQVGAQLGVYRQVAGFAALAAHP